MTLRVVVTDNKGFVGEDRRVFHLRHSDAELAGFPMSFGTSLEAGASMADIEGRGVLDTIVAGSDGSVHAIRPDGSEAPRLSGHDQSCPRRRSVLSVQLSEVARVEDETDSRFRTIRSRARSRLATSTMTARSTSSLLRSMDSRTRGTVPEICRPGFPVFTDRSVERQSVPPPNTPNSYNPMTGSFGGAALGDLEGTGQLDIVMGGWDGENLRLAS